MKARTVGRFISLVISSIRSISSIGCLGLFGLIGGPSTALADTNCPPPSQHRVLTDISNDFVKAALFVTRSVDDGFKSLEELGDYLLHALSSSERKNYLKYQDEIAVAAKAFQIPNQYLTCQLNSESRFSPTVRSDAGAVGICQFESGSIEAMSEIVSGSNRDTKIPGTPAAIVRDLWLNYPWSATKATPKRSYTAADRTNAVEILPLCAMFAKENALAIFGEAGEADWSPEKIEILVASYNLGLGGLQSICGKDSITDPQSCIDKLNPKNHSPSAASHHKALLQVWAEMNQVGDCVKSKGDRASDFEMPAKEVPAGTTTKASDLSQSH